MTKKNCPCGLNKSYSECCLPFHQGTPCPTTEKLLRARFCAFIKKNTKFLIDTHHPMYLNPRIISDLEHGNFDPTNLSIIKVDGGSELDFQGTITYSFNYNEGKEFFKTTSLYSRIGDRWFYEKDN